jgi:hypothetical protein
MGDPEVVEWMSLITLGRVGAIMIYIVIVRSSTAMGSSRFKVDQRRAGLVPHYAGATTPQSQRRWRHMPYVGGDIPHFTVRLPSVMS